MDLITDEWGKYLCGTYMAWLPERGYDDAVWCGTTVVGEGPTEGVVGLRDRNQLGIALGGKFNVSEVLHFCFSGI
jgi:hypothetical protein